MLQAVQQQVQRHSGSNGSLGCLVIVILVQSCERLHAHMWLACRRLQLQATHGMLLDAVSLAIKRRY